MLVIESRGNYKMRERAIVYIDGFNLYFGLKSSLTPKTESTAIASIQKISPTVPKNKYRLTKHSYWLDLQKLAERIVQNRHLVGVKYFTARIKGDPQKQDRQNAFLDAIHWHCDKVQTFEGRYLLREMICRKCHQVSNDMACPRCKTLNRMPEEKKSDVNIATQMLKDAYENLFDTAYLISADSDLVPPVEVIRSMTPSKRVIVVFPPNRFSLELKNAASTQLFISGSIIRQSRLPDEVQKPNGKITIPAEWNV